MGKKRRKNDKYVTNSIDYILLITVLLLLALGLIMVLSASSPKALAESGNSYSYFIKQAIFAILGLVCMFFISKIDYKRYKRFYVIGYIVSLVLLALVLTPLGKEVNGAQRWIGISKQLSFQPSEIVKFLLIIFYAQWLTIDRNELNKYWKGFWKHILPLAPIALLLLLEPHLSATMVMAAVSIIMMILAGCKFGQMVATGAAIGVPMLTVIILKFDYMLKRVTTFLDPWSDKLGDGWQIIQSLYAIGSGGLFGLGLGQSKQKYLYLPEPQNDFIFSVLAEELGFVGCMFVVILFGILVWRGILIAMKAPDMFGSLVAIGITALIGIQAIFNIAVVTSSMPATGMPLPFFSYGGTALFFLLCEIGVLLNISRAGNKNI